MEDRGLGSGIGSRGKTDVGGRRSEDGEKGQTERLRD